MHKNIFESQWILIGNVIVFGCLIFGLIEIGNRYRYICYLILILAIPFYLFGIISLIKYNKVLEKGKRINAEILPESIKLKVAYRGMSQFYYVCRYNTQYFKGTFSIKNRDVPKIERYIQSNSCIEVIVDYTNNRNIILIKEYLKNVCYCLDDYFCPPYFNHILIILIAILAILTII